jgi:hypothetical protein
MFCCYQCRAVRRVLFRRWCLPPQQLLQARIDQVPGHPSDHHPFSYRITQFYLLTEGECGGFILPGNVIYLSAVFHIRI